MHLSEVLRLLQMEAVNLVCVRVDLTAWSDSCSHEAIHTLSDLLVVTMMLQVTAYPSVLQLTQVQPAS